MGRTVPAAFFEPTSLGSLRRSAGSKEGIRLEVYPQVEAVLRGLATDGVRLGALSGPGQVSTDQLARLFEGSVLGGLFPRELIVAAAENTSSPFGRAAELTGHEEEPHRCLFVGEDRDMRDDALAVGLAVVPHVCLAGAGLRGARLRYIRVTVPPWTADESWREHVAGCELVPVRVVAEPAACYAIATSAAAAQLDDLGFQVDRLGAEDAPLATELYLLRDDRQTRTGFLVPEGASSACFAAEEEASRILASTSEGLYVAIPAKRSVESYHFEEARHGHTEKLMPDPSLLFGQPRRAGIAPQLETTAEPVLSEDERRAFGLITPERLASDLDRYSGSEPLDDSGARILSRHILHRDNALAVETLVGDLESIGNGQLEVATQGFLHEGAPLANVEALLGGADSDELVLLTAHLDSTGQASDGYEPLRTPAPGADDDASGLAAVLAIARTLVELRQAGPPKREIRLVLFNAEEHGMVGSKAYARDQAARGVKIIGVFQMDMIGYNRNPPRTFEVHAGFLASSEVQKRSRVLAERIAGAARHVSPSLPQPQIYLSTGPLERDPAEGRSDHASFQLVGYPACCTSEDFFAGPGVDAGSEPNPNYHMSSDTFVDAEYAADIARAVGAAAWLTANAA